MLVMFVLPIFVLIALVGSLPIWPHSKKWGFLPHRRYKHGDSDYPGSVLDWSLVVRAFPFSVLDAEPPASHPDSRYPNER